MLHSKFKWEHMNVKCNLDGTWGNGVFKLVIKGSKYTSFVGRSRYGKGMIVYDDKEFTITSTHARQLFFWTSFVEVVKGKFVCSNGEITVSEIEGRYTTLNGIWVCLKGKYKRSITL
jgi:hypothetical protein